MTAITADHLLEHSAWARNLARRLVQDAATADDVVQEAWLAALRNPPDDSEPVRPWLSTVIRRVAVKERRGSARRLARERVAARDEALPAATDMVEAVEGQQRLTRAVLELDEPYREAVLLRWFEGIEPKEIARRMGVPAGTVRWRISEGLTRLRASLEGGQCDGRRDGRHWALALMPLAIRGQHVGASSLVLFGGAITLKTHEVLLAAAAVVVFGFAALFAGGLALTPQAQPEVSEMEVAAEEGGEAAAVVRTEAVPETFPETVAETGGAGEPSVPAAAAGSATLRARFLDTSGAPIEGVDVRFSRRSARTDQEGRVELRIDDLDPRYSGGELRATRAGFARSTRQLKLRAGETDLGDIELVAGGVIEGRVVDSEGRPMPRAHVRVEGFASQVNVGGGMFMRGDRTAGEVQLMADDDGRFRLEGVLAESQTVFASFGSGFDSRWMEGELRADVRPGETTTVRVVIEDVVDPAQRITIHVRRPDGEPVEDGTYVVRDGRGGMSSASLRSSTVYWLAKRAPRRIVIKDSRDRWNAIELTDVPLGEERTVTFAAVEEFELRIASDRAAALDGVRVELRQPEPSFFARVRGTRARVYQDWRDVVLDGGATACRLPDGPFLVKVFAEGHEEGEFGPFDPALATAGGLDVTLTARPMLRGVVRSVGAPVAGAQVELMRRVEYRTTVDGFPVWQDPHAVETATTDADGRFSMTLRGREPFFVRAQKGDRVLETSELSEASPLELDLLPGGSIVGMVRDAGGKIAGRIVGASRGDGRARSVRVGPDGSFRLDGLLPGPWTVEIIGRELGNGSSSSSTPFPPIVGIDGNCMVTAGQETRFDITLGEVADARLEGRIALQGLPSGTPILLRRVARDGSELKSARTLLKADGSFVVDRLVAGSWRVSLQSESWFVHGAVEIGSGKNTLTLVPETGRVTVTNVESDQNAGTFVTWRSQGLTVRRRAKPDANGIAMLDDVPAGDLTIERTPQPDEMYDAMLSGGDPHLVTGRSFRVVAGGEAKVSAKD